MAIKLSDFDYELPPQFIAQTPIEPRDHSRLMVLHRQTQAIEHHQFYQLGDYLRSGDVLVFNDSRVIPARLFVRAADGTSGEVLLLRRLDVALWESLLRPGKKLRVGAGLAVLDANGLDSGVVAEVVAKGASGTCTLRFSDEGRLLDLGKTPLPPYIKTPLETPGRYQTVYARIDGSVAAPTAGLHFTPELLDSLKNLGCQLVFVSLHIGLDTFRPVRVEDPQRHPIHREYGMVSQEAADCLNTARKEGRRIVAVGTSSVRLLEAVARASSPGQVQSFSGWVDLFILPGHDFRLVDAMVTNFHLPRSTLLLLVSAFAGREFVLKAYDEARKQGYRFYSFGDAMLVL